MGFLGNIAKRLKAKSQKDLDKSFYKRRDQKLNKAITAGKVTSKQLAALKTVRSQKDTPKKKIVAKKKGVVPLLVRERKKKNKLIKEATGG